jgi:hypothetical protein
MTVRTEVGLSLNAVLTSKEAQALNESEQQLLEAVFTAASNQSGTGGVLSQRDLTIFEKTDFAKDPQYAKVFQVLDALVLPSSAAPRSVGVLLNSADGSKFEANVAKAATEAAAAITHQLSALTAAERQAALERWSKSGVEVVSVKSYALTLSCSDAQGNTIEAKATGMAFDMSKVTLSSAPRDPKNDPDGIRAYLTSLMTNAVKSQTPQKVNGVAKINKVTVDNIELAIPVPALSHAPTTI